MNSDEHIRWALEWVEHHLTDPLAAGAGLDHNVIALCKTRRFEEAVRCGHQLYQLGLQSSDAYAQGMAYLLLGSVYFALGERPNDWDKALDYYRQSVPFLHSEQENHWQHNEGIALMCMGRLCETYSTRYFKDKWDDAISLYQQAHQLFESAHDTLSTEAEGSERRVSQKFTDRVTIQKHTNQLRSTSRPPQPTTPAPPVVANLVHPLATPATGNRERYKRDTAGLLILSFTIFGAISLILIGAALTQPPYTGPLFIGYFVIVAPILVVFTLMSMYSVPKDQAAVIERRGRAWEIEPAGWHWRIPIVDNVKGNISLMQRPIRFVLRDHATPDGCIVNVVTHVNYSVTDLDRVWIDVVQSIHSVWVVSALGIDVIQVVDAHINDQAKNIVKQTLVEIANNPTKRAVFDQPANLPSFFLGELASHARSAGLTFETISVESHVRC